MNHETARRLSQLLSEYAGDAKGLDDVEGVDADMLDEDGSLTASQSFDRLAERFPSGERDVLQDKVFELEQRVLAAEIRAQQAEAKYRSLVHGESSVSRLQALVQEQMELRAADARQVEAKAARIKDWVGAKLRELEAANQTLRDELQAVKARSEAPDLARAPPCLPRCEETTHDYAEIYTPCRDTQPWDPAAWEQTQPQTQQPSDDCGDSEPPPPPPLHRFPSWESRIYRVAEHGLVGSLANGGQALANGGQALANQAQALEPKALGYQDTPAPVYAAVKGRASQIRSVPLSGDSSDGSTDDDETVDLSANGALSSSSASLSEWAEPGGPGSTNGSAASSLPPEEGGAKTGPVSQLGGRLKTWRRRHAELEHGVLSLFRRENDAAPRLRLALSERCRVTRTPGASTFTLEAPPPAGPNAPNATATATAPKLVCLAADSAAAAEDWVRAINAAVLHLTARSTPAISGWATRVRNGRSRRVWLSLAGKTLIYFRSPHDARALGQVDMREARAAPLDDASDSDSDQSQRGTAELTIGVFPRHGPPTYLRVASRSERDAWLYQLAVVSGLADSAAAGTDFEQLVAKLVDLDGEPGCVLWRHPTLLHSKECITAPLTTLPGNLQAEAIKLYKCCQLFMSAPLHASAGIDYHVALAQNALAQALAQPELQGELLAALVKLTSRPPQPRATGVQQLLLCATQSLFACETLTALDAGSPTSTSAPSVSEPSLVQGWQLLALAVSLFLPRGSKLLWLLKAHLQRNADSRTECGKYAAYCLRALERTLANGGRENKPSRMEALSLLLKNPYHHSLPHAMPVHLLSTAYQVVGFDGSTTVREFEAALSRELGMRAPAASGFALFSDDPIDRGLEHSLHADDKLCDVISRWETALREKGCGKFETSRVIQLSFKRRLSWKRSWRGETERERVLLCYQTSQQVVNGRFPVSVELAQELAALMAQLDLGEFNSERARGSGGGGGPLVLDKFFPYRYKDSASPTRLKELEAGLQERWEALKGQPANECARIYLACARMWPYFGATLYQAAVKSSSPSVVWLAVSESGVSLLDLAAMTTVRHVSYDSVVTFGGCRDDFMLVAHDDGRTHKMVFALARHRIVELTLLVADYMNALGHALPPGTPLIGSLSRRSPAPDSAPNAT